MRLDRLANDNGLARHEVAIAIHPDFHDRGLGLAALRLVRALVPGAVLDATVFAENKASRALFCKCRIYRDGTRSLQEQTISRPVVKDRQRLGRGSVTPLLPQTP